MQYTGLSTVKKIGVHSFQAVDRILHLHQRWLFL
jgi:hypothetical protein